MWSNINPHHSANLIIVFWYITQIPLFFSTKSYQTLLISPDFIRPACLTTGKLEDDATFIAAGWGVIPRFGDYSHVKKFIPLPLFNTGMCQKAYGNTPLPQNVICAGGEPGVDTCSGDSGGPLVWMKERGELWGVISSGSIHCGSTGVPGIYTKVVDYLEWIKGQSSIQ